MPTSVVYDISRLITRVLNATPNGIDRVDWLLARHFLAHTRFETLALRFGFAGPRLLPKPIARDAADRVAAAWKEAGHDEEPSDAYEEVVARIAANRRR